MTLLKLQNKKASKVCYHKDMTKIFGTHDLINIQIHLYSVLLSVVIEWVNLLMVTIVTSGIANSEFWYTI